METKLLALAQLISTANKITVLTGAGISTESGIPDFRSSTGLWTYNASRQSLMSIDFLRSKPKQFWPIYKDVFGIKMTNEFKPNAGHLFLSELEKQGKDITILTQNVDGLHGTAGNSTVFEIHGTITHAFCPKHPQYKYDLNHINEQLIPRCTHVNGKGHECKFILHPGVVLFGDKIKHYDEAVEASVDCDLFIVAGTSLQVGPINEMPIFAKLGGSKKRLVLINNEPTEFDEYFDIIIRNGIGDTFNKINNLLNRSENDVLSTTTIKS